MTEQTAREQIADALGGAYASGYLDGRDGDMDSYNYVEGVDSILTIIRTALLSEPAVDAAAYQMDAMFGESYSLSAARDVISAAWDSVMGEGSSE